MKSTSGSSNTTAANLKYNSESVVSAFNISVIFFPTLKSFAAGLVKKAIILKYCDLLNETYHTNIRK